LTSNHHIQAILFDLDGTLRESNPNPNKAFYQYAKKIGAPVQVDNEIEAIRWAHQYWAGSSNMFSDSAAFGPQTPEFWENYARRQLEALGADPENARKFAPELRKAMSDEYNPSNDVIAGVFPTLELLSSQGYKLAVVSNRFSACEEELEHLGLLHFFDFVLVAGQVNSWKPDPGIFHHAVKHARVPATAALYIGDNYYADILGAQNAGLHPVLVDPLAAFPEANCPIVKTVSELPDLLKKPFWGSLESV